MAPQNRDQPPMPTSDVRPHPSRRSRNESSVSTGVLCISRSSFFPSRRLHLRGQRLLHRVWHQVRAGGFPTTLGVVTRIRKLQPSIPGLSSKVFSLGLIKHPDSLVRGIEVDGRISSGKPQLSREDGCKAASQVLLPRHDPRQDCDLQKFG
jgi:hypothetical protein